MSDPTHDPQQDYIASLEAEIEREKKRVEVYRIAGEQAVSQVDELRAQLAGTIPLAEHNRIVGETVKSLDAERTEFEERIAEMTAEADSHARTAVDLFEQLQSVKQQLTASQEQWRKTNEQYESSAKAVTRLTVKLAEMTEEW